VPCYSLEESLSRPRIKLLDLYSLMKLVSVASAETLRALGSVTSIAAVVWLREPCFAW